MYACGGYNKQGIHLGDSNLDHFLRGRAEGTLELRGSVYVCMCVDCKKKLFSLTVVNGFHLRKDVFLNSQCK